MSSGEFDEPNNELDRRIFHILSHGQKRQKEIVKLLSTSRFNSKSIRKRTRNLSGSYSWAKQTEDENYYYREDIGRQPNLRKPPANYEDIENLLSGLEIKLGVRSKTSVDSTQTTTRPELLNSLLEISNRNGEIFIKKNQLDRFFVIVDKAIEESGRTYSNESPPPNYPEKTHGLLYTLIAHRHERWKKGQAHEEFDMRVRDRLDAFIQLLSFVPPEVGHQIIRILAIVDIKKARDGLENMIRSNNYSEGELREHVESCYLYSNDVDVMINNLNMIKVDCENREVAKKIDAIKRLVRD